MSAAGDGTVVGGAARRGLFRSMADFAARIDPRLVNKRAFESLVTAGAFDALEFQPRAGIRRRRGDPGGVPAQP